MESSEQYNLIADEFQADQYTMQVDGEDYSIMYRLFVPDGYENGGADLASFLWLFIIMVVEKAEIIILCQF